jgi:transcriptional regulator with XRE-family HTH domain
MGINNKQVQELLGSGLSQETVASAVGCDPSYISQLMSNEEFASVVLQKRSAALTAHTKRDLSLDSLEDKIITKLDEVIDYVHKPLELTRILHVVNNAKRRGPAIINNEKPIQQIIQLQLPKSVRTLFTVSKTGEVIDVNGQTLITMDSKKLIEQIPRGEISEISESIENEKFANRN